MMLMVSEFVRRRPGGVENKLEGVRLPWGGCGAVGGTGRETGCVCCVCVRPTPVPPSPHLCTLTVMPPLRARPTETAPCGPKAPSPAPEVEADPLRTSRAAAHPGIAGALALPGASPAASTCGEWRRGRRRGCGMGVVGWWWAVHIWWCSGAACTTGTARQAVVFAHGIYDPALPAVPRQAPPAVCVFLCLCMCVCVHALVRPCLCVPMYVRV